MLYSSYHFKIHLIQGFQKNKRVDLIPLRVDIVVGENIID